MIKQITNILKLLTYFVIALWITGCDKISELNQPSAHEVLTRYLDASLKSRSEEAYGYISSEDQAVKSLSEYKLETKNKDDYFAEGFENKVSFRVLNVTEAGNTAKAHVELTVPDLESIFTDIMGMAFSSAFGGKEEAEIEDLLGPVNTKHDILCLSDLHQVEAHADHTATIRTGSKLTAAPAG